MVTPIVWPVEFDARDAVGERPCASYDTEGSKVLVAYRLGADPSLIRVSGWSLESALEDHARN
jgi:hypothetical protein